MSKSAESRSSRPNTIFDDIAELTPKQRRLGVGAVAFVLALTATVTAAGVLASQKPKEETVASFDFAAESNGGKTANDILIKADAKLGVSENDSPFSYDEVSEALAIAKAHPGDLLTVDLGKAANIYSIDITDVTNEPGSLANTN